MVWTRSWFDSYFPAAPDSPGLLESGGEGIGATPFDSYPNPPPVPWPALPGNLSWGATPPLDVPRLPPYGRGYVPLPALSFGPEFDESRPPSEEGRMLIRTPPYDLRRDLGGPTTLPYFPSKAPPQLFDLDALTQPGPWYSPYFYDPRVPMLDRAPDASSLMQPLAYNVARNGLPSGPSVTIPLSPQTWPIPPETPAPPTETPAWETLYLSGGVLDPTHQAAYDSWERPAQREQTMPDASDHAGFQVWADSNGEWEPTLQNSANDGLATWSNPNSEWRQPIDGSELSSNARREEGYYEERFKGLAPEISRWVNPDAPTSREGPLSEEERAAVVDLARHLKVDPEHIIRVDPAPATLLANIMAYRHLGEEGRRNLKERLENIFARGAAPDGDIRDALLANKLQQQINRNMTSFPAGDPRTFSDAEIDTAIKVVDTWRTPETHPGVVSLVGAALGKALGSVKGGGALGPFMELMTRAANARYRELTTERDRRMASGHMDRE